MWKLLEKIGLVKNIYGDKVGTLYMRRFFLTPRRFPLQLMLHVFYRGDEDPDPHDHPWAFWTYPLSRLGYYEHVMEPDGTVLANYTPGRTWTKREKNYTHRVIGPIHKWDGDGLPHLKSKPWSMWTLVVRETKVSQDWGFWVKEDNLKKLGWCGAFIDRNPTTEPGPNRRIKVPFRSYLYGEPQSSYIRTER